MEGWRRWVDAAMPRADACPGGRVSGTAQADPAERNEPAQEGLQQRLDVSVLGRRQRVEGAVIREDARVCDPPPSACARPRQSR